MWWNGVGTAERWIDNMKLAKDNAHATGNVINDNEFIRCLAKSVKNVYQEVLEEYWKDQDMDVDVLLKLIMGYEKVKIQKVSESLTSERETAGAVKTGLCFKCNQPGHYANECSQQQGGQQRKREYRSSRSEYSVCSKCDRKHPGECWPKCDVCHKIHNPKWPPKPCKEKKFILQ